MYVAPKRRDDWSMDSDSDFKSSSENENNVTKAGKKPIAELSSAYAHNLSQPASQSRNAIDLNKNPVVLPVSLFNDYQGVQKKEEESFFINSIIAPIARRTPSPKTNSLLCDKSSDSEEIDLDWGLFHQKNNSTGTTPVPSSAPPSPMPIVDDQKDLPQNDLEQDLDKPVEQENKNACPCQKSEERDVLGIFLYRGSKPAAPPMGVFVSPPPVSAYEEDQKASLATEFEQGIKSLEKEDFIHPSPTPTLENEVLTYYPTQPPNTPISFNEEQPHDPTDGEGISGEEESQDTEYPQSTDLNQTTAATVNDPLSSTTEPREQEIRFDHTYDQSDSINKLPQNTDYQDTVIPMEDPADSEKSKNSSKKTSRERSETPLSVFAKKVEDFFIKFFLCSAQPVESADEDESEDYGSLSEDKKTV